MMLWLRRLCAITTVSLLAACGGGGGGSSLYAGGTAGGGSGSGSGSGSGTPTSAYTVTVTVERAGIAASSVTSTESVQAVALVLSASGSPIEGALVNFSETAGSLLRFSPSAATALTGADGKASLDVAASSSASTGATVVSAATTIAGASYSGTKAISISAGTAAVPASINFVSVTPSDSAIVIQGTGGTGRSESATLTFKAVDGGNAPVANATVYFRVDNPSAVTLNVSSGVTNSDGLVTTTVTSKSIATSVVVIAEARSGATVIASAQSDSLLISNGVADPQAFEIVAQKYNLDSLFTGDSTTITAFVADSNGNPVPDGLAVSFTTNAGAVGSSSMGGCTTVNGTCSVDFRVQEPRGSGIATIIGQIIVPGQPVLSDQVQVHFAGSTSGSYSATLSGGGAIPSPYTLSSCSGAIDLLLQDGSVKAPAAGTVIAVSSASSGVSGSIDNSPVPDQLLSGFPPVHFTVQLTLSSDVCGSQVSSMRSGQFNLKFTTPHGIVYTQRVDIRYPGPDPVAPSP